MELQQSTPFPEQKKIESFLFLQDYIEKKQADNKPFFIGRLSGNETALSGHILSNSQYSNNLLVNMLYVAGIQFLKKQDVVDYVKQYNKAVSNTDVLGIWDGAMYRQAQAYYSFIERAYPKLNYICAEGFEPYYYMNNPNYKFNELFKNKKVLVITSHKETACLQISKKNTIFKTPIFHESTEFIVYKPPQQNAGSHDSNPWYYHLDKMKSDIKNIGDFDIALISCGGFGMIISNFIFTDLGKSAIYVGGALQLFFGIMGNRWKSSPKITEHMNHNWTNVLECDHPKQKNTCEGGCYW